MSTQTMITLDLAGSWSQASVVMKRGDNTRNLIVLVTDNNLPFVFEENDICMLRAAKPDGTYTYTECTIAEDGKITCPLPSQIATALGQVKCELNIYNEETGKSTTAKFSVIVEDGVYEDTLVESTNEFSGLTALIMRVQDAINSVKAIFKKLEEYRKAGDFNGTTFFPHQESLASDRVKFSWTNNRELENPADVIITAPKGDKGDKGDAFTYNDLTQEQRETLQEQIGDLSKYLNVDDFWLADNTNLNTLHKNKVYSLQNGLTYTNLPTGVTIPDVTTTAKLIVTGNEGVFPVSNMVVPVRFVLQTLLLYTPTGVSIYARSLIFTEAMVGGSNTPTTKQYTFYLARDWQQISGGGGVLVDGYSENEYTTDDFTEIGAKYFSKIEGLSGGNTYIVFDENVPNNSYSCISVSINYIDNYNQGYLVENVRSDTLPNSWINQYVKAFAHLDLIRREDGYQLMSLADNVPVVLVRKYDIGTSSWTEWGIQGVYDNSPENYFNIPIFVTEYYASSSTLGQYGQYPDGLLCLSDVKFGGIGNPDWLPDFGLTNGQYVSWIYEQKQTYKGSNTHFIVCEVTARISDNTTKRYILTKEYFNGQETFVNPVVRANWTQL